MLSEWEYRVRSALPELSVSSRDIQRWLATGARSNGAITIAERLGAVSGGVIAGAFLVDTLAGPGQVQRVGAEPMVNDDDYRVALGAVEFAIHESWGDIPEPQAVLDGVLAAWGGAYAREDRLALRPAGLDRLYFGASASRRMRDQLLIVANRNRNLSM